MRTGAGAEGNEAEVRDDDGIDWQWRGQSGGSDFYDSLVRALLRHTPRGALVLEVGVGSGYALSELVLKAGCVCVGSTFSLTQFMLQGRPRRHGELNCIC